MVPTSGGMFSMQYSATASAHGGAASGGSASRWRRITPASPTAHTRAGPAPPTAASAVATAPVAGSIGAQRWPS